MSVPNVLFIDTSILDQQNYNFESATFIPFIHAVKGKNLTYLLPNPIIREINRHIAERADDVVKALEEARRKAPFLAKHPKWPAVGFATSWELRTIAMGEWRNFLLHFNVVRLGYEGVNLMEIMDWYDKHQAPFSPKKKKEFPDALALSSVLHYARTNRVSVAIISTDNDFKEASDLFTELLHFASLPAYNEALIASDERVSKVKLLLNDHNYAITEGITGEFEAISFYPAANPDGLVEDVKVEDVEFNKLHVINIGAQECTIAFEASISYTAYVEYVTDYYMNGDVEVSNFGSEYQYSGRIADYASVNGEAKLSLNSQWTAFGDLKSIHLENDEIEVDARPGITNI